MTAPRIAIIGTGKMGRAIEQLAVERGIEVTAAIGSAANRGGAGITRETLGEADVAIEFTDPASAPRNVRACVRAGCPVVVGTTGWHGALPTVSEEVRAADGAMLWASNFSIGVNLYFEIVDRAAELLARAPSFDAQIVETHHAAKRDAPSGTALAVQSRVESALGRRVAIESVRTGYVPGTHELIFDGPFEQIRLVHEARDRRVFADGALLAAAWLVGRRGVFTMSDVLRPEPGDGR